MQAQVFIARGNYPQKGRGRGRFSSGRGFNNSHPREFNTWQNNRQQQYNNRQNTQQFRFQIGQSYQRGRYEAPRYSNRPRQEMYLANADTQNQQF